MPNYSRPTDGESAEQAISVFGNRMKVGIIRYLRQHPNVTRKSIAQGLGLEGSSTLPVYLGELESQGLILADPPRADRRRGEWPIYRVNDLYVTELFLWLGQEIGEL